VVAAVVVWEGRLSADDEGSAEGEGRLVEVGGSDE